MLLKARKVENPVVHHEQAELGPAEVPDVDNFGDEEPLRNIVYSMFRKTVDVMANPFNIQGEADTKNDPVPYLDNQHVNVAEAIYETYHGKHDEIVIPPQLLLPDSSTNKA